MLSATELTAKVPASWPTFAAMLEEIPPKDVSIALPARLATLGPDRPEVRTVLGKWEASGIAALKKAVGEAKTSLR